MWQLIQMYTLVYQRGNQNEMCVIALAIWHCKPCLIVEALCFV